jgi:hypothetical protein
MVRENNFKKKKNGVSSVGKKNNKNFWGTPKTNVARYIGRGRWEEDGKKEVNKIWLLTCVFYLCIFSKKVKSFVHEKI